jgi:hypothetical protein
MTFSRFDIHSEPVFEKLDIMSHINLSQALYVFKCGALLSAVDSVLTKTTGLLSMKCSIEMRLSVFLVRIFAIRNK